MDSALVEACQYWTQGAKVAVWEDGELEFEARVGESDPARSHLVTRLAEVRAEWDWLRSPNRTRGETPDETRRTPSSDHRT